jgi:hypothetical protein
MIKHNQDGVANGVMISLVFSIILLLGASGFAGWAYTNMTDYRDNVDQKVQIAEQEAIKAESAVKDKQFAEEQKSPLKPYGGPAAYGSVQLNYPKTWSGYVDDTGSGQALVDGFFNPGVVPSVSDQKSVFALRLQVISQNYAQFVKSLNGQVASGKLKVSAYSLPKQKKVVGIRAVGQLSNSKNVNMIVLPLRSQTIKIWTEGDQHVADFDKYILPNFNFSP